MIGRLTGTLLEKTPPQLLIDCAGVGYEVDVPMSTFYDLPAIGSRLALHTHLVVREDAQLLYGFGTLEERTAFRQLIRISGTGARTALAILSGLSVTDLARAVAVQDAALLTRVPGIGKKTAERLMLELKGKFEAAAGVGGVHWVEASAGADIVNALAALGYSDKETAAVFRKLPGDVGVSDGIRQALKLLSKA